MLITFRAGKLGGSSSAEVARVRITDYRPCKKKECSPSNHGLKRERTGERRLTTMEDEWNTVTKDKRRLAPQTSLTKANFSGVEPKKGDAKKRGKSMV